MGDEPSLRHASCVEQWELHHAGGAGDRGLVGIACSSPPQLDERESACVRRFAASVHSSSDSEEISTPMLR